MATWKKVLVSGSAAAVTDITSSATPTVSSIGTNYVVMIEPTTGYVSKITAGNFQAGLGGAYSFNAGADVGSDYNIGSGSLLDIVGGGGIDTEISTIAGGAQIAVTLDTGSSHFINGARGTISVADTTGASGIDLTYSSGQISGTLVNSSVTVNGTAISLGSSGTITANTTNTLTLGSGLTGTSFNGSSAVTTTVDSGSMATYFRQNAYSNVSGDITINSSGVAAIGSGVIVDADIANGTISNTKLVNSSIYLTAGNGLTGDGSVALGASGSLAVGTGTGITVNANDVALKNAGSLTNNYVTKWDSGNGQLTNSVISDNGSTVSVAASLDVSGGITGSSILVGTPVGIATPGQIRTQDRITVENSGIDITGDSIFNNDLVVTGDLTVNGTATYINTTELLVEDKFALFASGSATAVDGGIIVQASTGGGTATGYGYGYENTADRWVYQDALAFNATAFATPTAYAVSAEFAAAAPSAAPAYGGASYGYGNIHVNTSTGEIFIYS